MNLLIARDTRKRDLKSAQKPKHDNINNYNKRVVTCLKKKIRRIRQKEHRRKETISFIVM